MGTEQEQIPIRLRLENQLGDEEFQDLLFYLNGIFEEDYSDKIGKPFNRAKFLFEEMKSWHIMKSELKPLLEKFSINHKGRLWRPADFHEIWLEI